MSEIERAIELFEDEVRILYGHGNLSSPEIIDAHELAIKLLRAELSRQENAPLTWNERINQMTVEEKAKWFDAHMDWCPFDICTENQNCEYCYAKFLASPYTEGEKENG